MWEFLSLKICQELKFEFTWYTGDLVYTKASTEYSFTEDLSIHMDIWWNSYALMANENQFHLP